MTNKDLKAKIKEAVEISPYQKSFKKVSLFGSYAHGKPSKGSDLDILVEFTKSAKIGLFDLVRIKLSLKKFLDKEVDLVTKEGLKKGIKEEVLSKACKIYEKR